MATITATAPNGETFTRNTKVAWTHACIKTYSNGVNHIHWAKSEAAAQELADHNDAFAKSLTEADKVDVSAYLVGAVAVATTITH